MDSFQCGSQTVCQCECANQEIRSRGEVLFDLDAKRPLCEHTFSGWEDFINENGKIVGGTSICARCGMTAMEHSMWVLP